MKFLSSVKSKVLALAGILGLSAPALAQGSGDSTIDLTFATDLMTSLSTAVTSFLTAAKPFLITILGVVVVVTLVWVAVKWFRKGTNKA